MIKYPSIYVHRAYFLTPEAANVFLDMLDARGSRFFAEQIPEGYMVHYGV